MNEVPREFRSTGEHTLSRLDNKNQQIIAATADRIQSETAQGIVAVWRWYPPPLSGQDEPPLAADLHDAFADSLKRLQRAMETSQDDDERRDLIAQLTALVDGYMRDIKPKAQLTSCVGLCHAWQLRGMTSYILGDYAAAVDDAAAIYHAMNCLCPGKPMSRIVDALLLKGKAEYGRGDLATAEEDLRACCAYKRAQGEDLFKTEEVRWLLGVMARQKDGTPRPHYSDQERHAICRELGLDMYSSKCMTCQACQRPPSADLRLKLCKQCQQSWYCSRECQRRHWPEHKRGCTPLLPRQNVIIMHTVEPKYKAAIDAGGFAFTEHKNAGTQALCVDPETGRMFQSITDHEIMFFDPNAEGNPLMGMMLGSLLGGGRQRRDGAMGSRGPVVGTQYPDPFIIYPEDSHFREPPDDDS